MNCGDTSYLGASVGHVSCDIKSARLGQLHRHRVATDAEDLGRQLHVAQRHHGQRHECDDSEDGKLDSSLAVQIHAMAPDPSDTEPSVDYQGMTVHRLDMGWGTDR